MLSPNSMYTQAEAAGTRQRRTVLYPQGRFMLAWRPILLAAVLFAISMTPVDLGFLWWRHPDWYILLAKVLDAIFLVDMVLNFNTAYVKHGRLVTNRRQIAKHYLKTYLIVDIVANFPVDWLMDDSGSRAGKSRKIVKLSKLPKLLRLIKLFRTLRDTTPFFGVWSICAALVLVAHYYACGWVWLLLGDCPGEDLCPSPWNTYAEGLQLSIAGLAGSDSWLRITLPHREGLLTATRPVDEPLGIGEDLLAVSMTVVGLMLIAGLVANMAAAISNRGSVARMRAKMLKRRKREMKLAQLPPVLQQKVVATYEHLWRFGGDEWDGMLGDPVLSLDLRRNLALHLFGPALRKVPILARIPDRFLKCLAQKVQTRLYMPGDLMVLCGEVGSELFIIHSGCARPVDADDEPIRDVVLAEGSFFGEACFLHPGSRRTASVMCMEFCKAMVLTVGAFKELQLTGLLKAIRKEAKTLEQEYVCIGTAPLDPRAATFDVYPEGVERGPAGG